MRKIKGVLIDFDGVLVDTDKSTIAFYNRELEKKGLKIEDHHLSKKVGRKSYDFLKEVLGDKLSDDEIWQLIHKKRESFVREFEKYVYPIPDGMAMVKKFKAMGLKTALVSGNSREMLLKALEVLNIRDLFDVIISWEDVENKKPHPECYFKACDLLRLSPNEVVVVEDSELGIIGAKNGGFLVATIATPFNKHILDKVEIVRERFVDIPSAVLDDPLDNTEFS